MVKATLAPNKTNGSIYQEAISFEALEPETFELKRSLKEPKNRGDNLFDLANCKMTRMRCNYRSK